MQMLIRKTCGRPPNAIWRAVPTAGSITQSVSANWSRGWPEVEADASRRSTGTRLAPARSGRITDRTVGLSRPTGRARLSAPSRLTALPRARDAVASPTRRSADAEWRGIADHLFQRGAGASLAGRDWDRLSVVARCESGCLSRLWSTVLDLARVAA